MLSSPNPKTLSVNIHLAAVAREVMLGEDSANDLGDLAAALLGWLDRIGIVGRLGADQPQIDYRLARGKCQAQYHVIEEREPGCGDALQDGIRVVEIVDRADGGGQIARQDRVEHRAVILLELLLDVCQPLQYFH